MILLRLADGIRDHFPARASEWTAVIPAIGMGWVLNRQPDLFSTGTAYANVAGWLTEEGWAALFLICAILRLGALIVNGTFHNFRHSPLIRLFVAGVTAMAWFQFWLGFALEWAVTGRAPLLTVLLAYMVVVEGLNIYRSSHDRAGVAHGQLARN